MRISDWSSDVCSSDLLDQAALAQSAIRCPGTVVERVACRGDCVVGIVGAGIGDFTDDLFGGRIDVGVTLAAFRIDELAAYQQRSEEHTSELQSLMRISYAVFCLKKKTKLLCSQV